jgi:hypothetical protein
MVGGKYYTVNDVLTQALQSVGAVSFGEAIEPAVYQSSLLQLNSLLSKWSNNYMNYNTFDNTIMVKTNTAVINMGLAINGELPVPTSGDILERPATIDQVDIIMGTLTFQVPIKSYSEYTNLPIKNVVSIPQACYFIEGMPFNQLWFFPMVPAGYSIRVVGKSYFDFYQSIADLVVLPPEYIEALIYNLALHLSPMFGQNPSEGLITMANSAMKHIKQRNVINNIPRLKNDFSNAGSFNFWAGC